MIHKKFYTLPEDIGKRLDHFLWEAQQRVLQPSKELLSRGQIRKLIVAGGVYWNRHRVRIASKPVSYPLMLEWYWDESRHQSNTHSTSWEITGSEVLYHKEGLLVVNKPSGLPTQPTVDEARENLFQKVKLFLKTPYLGLHHRLDRETSGAILFTTESSLNSRISNFFKNHQIKKTYWALVHNPKHQILPSEWTIENYLGPKSRWGKKMRYGSISSGGSWAKTVFRIKGSNPKKSLLWIEAKPETGRTHQIRIHLAEMGLPLLGDSFYGYQGPSLPRFFLHSRCLEWPLLTAEALESVYAPLPSFWKETFPEAMEEPFPL